ncbi:hypothetical protein AMTR_s00039p00215740 [Amborella trichopoda]|uniref:Uncharacterized protein n=1 Tax=Amborella trichopoda TaxID=13333 RepID=U5D0W6_AMBTC|nr:hypothetical protein AMTR_s00039p00215740 [Amborella trichopoda]
MTRRANGLFSMCLVLSCLLGNRRDVQIQPSTCSSYRSKPSCYVETLKPSRFDLMTRLPSSHPKKLLSIAHRGTHFLKVLLRKRKPQKIFSGSFVFLLLPSPLPTEQSILPLPRPPKASPSLNYPKNRTIDIIHLTFALEILDGTAKMTFFEWDKSRAWGHIIVSLCYLLRPKPLTSQKLSLSPSPLTSLPFS